MLYRKRRERKTFGPLLLRSEVDNWINLKLAIYGRPKQASIDIMSLINPTTTNTVVEFHMLLSYGLEIVQILSMKCSSCSAGNIPIQTEFQCIEY
ncbi:hypothetical protein IV203_021829 [Nitzschia inconspicua]|uniref:Uncharacterized protein n=1 Tax=Nitzschia inconspicua TaxID=303405 RepID=A0A9K3KI43_9STRA|nr:hypothetical protein IV203_033465 [Nitzschia inconspicua]KAG7343821.1 hypothetical protein IV203_021829 [Nitzschia inconspicua]